MADKEIETAELRADVLADDDDERRDLAALYARQRAEAAQESGSPESRDKWLNVATEVSKDPDEH